jgi:hypothetical protein
MADKKISELTAITNFSGDDLLLVVNDPSGTPSSNKITFTRLFANVTPNTTHNGNVTFGANATFTGTKITSTANVAITGDLSVNGYSVVTELDSKITTDAANDLINDRLQVANAAALYVSLGPNSSNSDQRISSNVHISSSNSTTGVTVANGAIIVRTGSNTEPSYVDLYSQRIHTANTANTYYTRIKAANNSALSNNAVVTLPSSNGTLALQSAVDTKISVANAVSNKTLSGQSIESTLTVHANSTLSNTGVYISDSQVTIYAATSGPAKIDLYSQAVYSANTSNTYNTRIIAQNNSDLANNVVVTLPVSNGTLALSSTVDDRMQVANTNTLVNDRMQVANVNLLVNDRLQVANASATYISLATLKTEVAAANSFAEFQARIDLL